MQQLIPELKHYVYMHNLVWLKLIFWLSEHLKCGVATGKTLLHFNLHVSNKLVMHTTMMHEFLHSFQRERSEQHQKVCILQTAIKGTFEQYLTFKCTIKMFTCRNNTTKIYLPQMS